MKVKNKRAIALAFLALILAGFSLFVYIAQGRVRFLFSAILALVWVLTLLYAGCVLAVFVYAVGKRPEALAVAVTLCGAAVVLLILSLAASRYYEKRG